MKRRAAVEVQYSSLFGKNVVLMRDFIGWSQTKLAEELNKRGGIYIKQYIHEIEFGMYHNSGYKRMRLDDFMLFVNVLGVTPSMMLSPLKGQWWSKFPVNPIQWNLPTGKYSYCPDVGRTIMECREAQGLFQYQLARKVRDLDPELRMSQKQISNVENGGGKKGLYIDPVMFLARALFPDTAPEVTVERWLTLNSSKKGKIG